MVAENFSRRVGRVAPPLWGRPSTFVAEAGVAHFVAAFAAIAASRSAISLRTLSHCWYWVRAV